MGMKFGEEEPAWLRSLLGATFFEPCPAHPDLAKNECNHYCLDCAAGHAICSLCLPANHRDHRVLQIRRSSYHDVIRVTEVEAVANVSLVQTYVLNADRVVFLNPRPRAAAPRLGVKGGVGAAVAACGGCGRGLLDAAFRFCSLDCKLGGVDSDRNLTFVIDSKRKRESEESSESLSRPTKLQKTGQISYRRRPRKGVPERAPFF